MQSITNDADCSLPQCKTAGALFITVRTCGRFLFAHKFKKMKNTIDNT